MKRYYVLLDGFSSLDDFGLILTSVSIGQPKPKTYLIEVPGRRTPIDATESLFGEVTYENRTIAMSFVRVHQGLDNFHRVLSDLMEQFHGRRIRVIFDTDPEFYYEGRAEVEGSASHEKHAEFTIRLDANPFKYQVNETTRPWLWDPFSFKTGEVIDYARIELSAGAKKTVSVVGSGLPVRPVVLSTKAIQLQVDESKYELPANEPVRIWEKVGQKDFTFTNNGPEKAVISIKFRGEGL